MFYYNIILCIYIFLNILNRNIFYKINLNIMLPYFSFEPFNSSFYVVIDLEILSCNAKV